MFKITAEGVLSDVRSGSGVSGFSVLLDAGFTPEQCAKIYNVRPRMFERLIESGYPHDYAEERANERREPAYEALARYAANGHETNEIVRSYVEYEAYAEEMEEWFGS